VSSIQTDVVSSYPNEYAKGSSDSGGPLSLGDLARGSVRLNEMTGGPRSSAQLFSTIRRVAGFKATVVVEGESGTGKELVARALHQLGPCPSGPFVTFNCANMVETLAESQLFGHVRGAFTDAREESQGYFRAAHDGTLFLDEIGELPLKLQPKLLRALETGEIQAVGSSKTHRVNVRIVTATNRDLKEMVKAGSFRADLYYRINVVGIQLPTLRSCRDAIPPLVARFIQDQNEALGKTIDSISKEALDCLCEYSWPGNVRELYHVIECAALMSNSDCLGIHDFPEEIGGSPYSTEDLVPRTFEPSDQRRNSSTEAPELPFEFSLDSALRRAGREAVLKALNQSAGNCIGAAQQLHISRFTVYRLIKRYGLKDLRTRGLYLGGDAQIDSMPKSYGLAQ